jgi:hypothetical protein
MRLPGVPDLEARAAEVEFETVAEALPGVNRLGTGDAGFADEVA